MNVSVEMRHVEWACEIEEKAKDIGTQKYPNPVVEPREMRFSGGNGNPILIYFVVAADVYT